MPNLSAIEMALQGMLDQEAAELVDLEYVHEGGRWILRFYLDKNPGITIDDCEYLSRRIEGILDMTWPVALPPMHSKQTVARSFFASSARFASKSGSLELRTYSALRSLSIFTCSSLRTTLIRGI